jgi:hypothetical protein
MAAHRVLAINELLELILLHLPLKDIIVARQVASSWKGLFDSSISIQKAAFLAPCAVTLPNVDRSASGFERATYG